MASIMVIMMDSRNGSVSSSFNFEENDVQRIYEAFVNREKDAHQREVDSMATFEDKQAVGDFVPPTCQDICNYISNRFMSDVTSTVYQAEVQAAVKKMGLTPITPKNKNS